MNDLKIKLIYILNTFTQTDLAGGIHMPPQGRLLLCSLALLLEAQSIIETGYDAGVTTMALALTGANVVGLDNLSEYPQVKLLARERLSECANCILLQEDALTYLSRAADNSIDLIFIDDNHNIDHVRSEAQQVHRILRPGGLAVFHDTLYHNLWSVIEEIFPGWQKISLPCVSPIEKEDFGLGLVRKP